MFKESVLQGLISRIATCTLKKQFVLLARNRDKHRYECWVLGVPTWPPNLISWDTHRVVISYILDLFIVISPSKLSQALRVESATVWEELGTVLLGQLCAERVDGDNESTAVGFKLQGQCIGEERGKTRRSY